MSAALPSPVLEIKAAYDQIRELERSLNSLWFEAFHASLTDRFLDAHIHSGEEMTLWCELRDLTAEMWLEAKEIRTRFMHYHQAELADSCYIHPEVARALALLNAWLESPRYADPALAMPDPRPQELCDALA